MTTAGQRTRGVLRAPEAIAVAPGGDLYVGDQFSHRIQRFSPGGDFRGSWGSYGAGRGQFGASATNQGDYTVAVINPGFNSLFAALQIALQPWSLVVNSGYRNPVHNAYHVDKGRGSGAVSDSWHQYGCGDDIQTFPILPVFPTAAQLAATQSYWDAVADEALSLGFTVEPRDRDPQHPDVSFSGVGHVHIELKCPLAQ